MTTFAQNSPFATPKKPETKVRPQDMLGGSMEILSETDTPTYNPEISQKIIFEDWLFQEAKTPTSNEIIGPFSATGSISFMETKTENSATAAILEIKDAEEPTPESKIVEAGSKAAKITAEKGIQTAVNIVKEGFSFTSMIGKIIGGELFWGEIIGLGKKREKPKDPKDEQKKQEGIFKINRFREITQSIKEAFRRKLDQALEVAARLGVGQPELAGAGSEISIYSAFNVARQKQEQIKAANEAEKSKNLVETQGKKASAINAAMEGGSGQMGGGSANLSATGGGAG